MLTTITILGQNLDVEYDFNITASGCGETGPTYSSGGEPAEPAEFEIEFLRLSRGVTGLEAPEWLIDLIIQHLNERDDINEIVQRADQERSFDDDGDY